MPTTVESTFTGLFDQAVHTFGDAIKAGVKLQEDVTRWWGDALEKAGPVADFQKRSLLTVREAIPVAQKNAEEWLKVFENNYRKSMDLLKRAFEARDTDTAADYQARLQEIWEGSLAMIREGAQTAAQTHVKMLELFADLLKKNLNGAPARQAVPV